MCIDARHESHIHYVRAQPHILCVHNHTHTACMYCTNDNTSMKYTRIGLFEITSCVVHTDRSSRTPMLSIRKAHRTSCFCTKRQCAVCRYALSEQKPVRGVCNHRNTGIHTRPLAHMTSHAHTHNLSVKISTDCRQSNSHAMAPSCFNLLQPHIFKISIH